MGCICSPAAPGTLLARDILFRHVSELDDRTQLVSHVAFLSGVTIYLALILSCFSQFLLDVVGVGEPWLWDAKGYFYLSASQYADAAQCFHLAGNLAEVSPNVNHALFSAFLPTFLPFPFSQLHTVVSKYLLPNPPNVLRDDVTVDHFRAETLRWT